MAENPKITVFMATFNAASYIRDAINSILNQTYPDFELLIVDDGSTDQTVSVIKSYTDPRIRLLENTANKGVAYTRNIAITEARGEYIAILDSDDIAERNRLELQVNFFQSHPDVALCGGNAVVIDKNDALTGERIEEPFGPEKIKMTLLFTNTYVNSTVMYKTSVFKELNGYQDYVVGEDYDLFIRIADKYPVGNLGEFLVKYRKHDTNISHLKARQTESAIKKIKETQLLSLGISPNPQLIDTLYSLLIYDYSRSTFQEYLTLFVQLKQANQRHQKYPAETFQKFLFNRWFEIIYLKKAKMNALVLLLDKRIYKSKYATASQIRKAFKLSLKGIGRISK